MIDDRAAATHSLRAAKQRARRVRFETRLAQRWPTGRARLATAAAGNESGDDMIAGPQVAHTGADLRHFAGALVTDASSASAAADRR